MNNLATQIREAVEGDKHTYYTELLLQAAELLDHKDTQINTRPAAPVEGLETIRTEAKTRFGWVPHPTFATTESTRDLVDKSQAEAMIAAERAKGEKFEKMWLDVEVENTKLKTDNAALTARVARDDAAFQELIKLGKEADTKFEALETQLATLKDAAKSVEDWWLSEGMNHFPGAPYCIFAIRAALEDRP